VEIAAAVDRADLDELERVIDACCEARDWDALAELRARCAQAFERGRQLWPIAARAEYRLALEAPAEHAAAVLLEGAGRFALGPLPEVAASTHSWAALAPHVTEGPSAVITLHERVVRGEDCTVGPLPGPPVLDLPRRLAEWEPDYAVAEYRSDSVHTPMPPTPALERLALPPPPERSTDIGSDALEDLTRAWTEDSGGRVESVAILGSPLDAIAALRPPTARVAPVTARHAIGMMAWAAASAGAHGRRAGAAAGRFAAWWALAAIADHQGDWPLDGDDLSDAIAELEFVAWDAAEPASGWELRLAVGSPRRGRAWAVAAIDAT